MGEMRNTYKIFVGKPEGKRHLGSLGVDEIVLECILKKRGLDSTGFGYGAIAGSCEHGNGTSGYARAWAYKCRMFLGKRPSNCCVFDGFLWSLRGDCTI
jgi:hypothetical protein